MLNGGGLLYTLKKQDPFFKKTSDLLSNKIWISSDLFLTVSHPEIIISKKIKFIKNNFFIASSKIAFNTY